MTMMGAWTDFAKTGNPGRGWTQSNLNTDHQYWNISGPNPIMEGRQEIRDRMAIWEEVCQNNLKC